MSVRAVPQKIPQGLEPQSGALLRSCVRVREDRNCSKGSGSAAALASPGPSPRRAPELPDVAVILGKGSGCLCTAEPKWGRWDGAVPAALSAGFVPERERAAPCRFESACVCVTGVCPFLGELLCQGTAVWAR